MCSEKEAYIKLIRNVYGKKDLKDMELSFTLSIKTLCFNK